MKELRTLKTDRDTSWCNPHEFGWCNFNPSTQGEVNVQAHRVEIYGVQVTSDESGPVEVFSCAKARKGCRVGQKTLDLKMLHPPASSASAHRATAHSTTACAVGQYRHHKSGRAWRRTSGWRATPSVSCAGNMCASCTSSCFSCPVLLVLDRIEESVRYSQIFDLRTCQRSVSE